VAGAQQELGKGVAHIPVSANLTRG
jgi:hypothetical protein